MDKMGEWEQKKLIKELEQGRELAKQLHRHNSSSSQTCEILLQRILFTYEKALSMLKLGGGGGSSFAKMSESSLSGSPKSQDSDRHGSMERRKSWTKRVRVSPGTGMEGPLDDGFSWRKYGQKHILGAKYPRGYYRCTLRNVQECLATKQVQRCDEDPMHFEITYRGRHTCTHQHHASNITIQQIHQIQKPAEPIQNPQQDHLTNLRSNFRVVTENLESDTTCNLQYSTPSNYPSLGYFASNIKPQTDIDVHSPSMMANFSPQLISPPTSSGFVETMSISTPGTSTTTSPGVGFDFSILEYDPNFSFDNPGLFS